MSGFWAGAVPPWAYVVGALGCFAFLLVGMWVGYGRGWKHAEEEARWAREQAKARRTHPVYREPIPWNAAEAEAIRRTQEANAKWLAHEDQALTIANETGNECPACHDTYVDLPGHLAANLKGCTDVLEPTAVLTHEEMFPWAGMANTATAPTWQYRAETPALVGQVVQLPVQEPAITTGEIQAITDEMDSWLAVHVYGAPKDYGQWLEQQDR